MGQQPKWSARLERDVHVKLFHVEWSRIALKDEVGRERIENQRKITEVGHCELKQVSQPKRCTIQALKSGEHFWVAEASDNKGVKTISVISQFLYGGRGGSWMEREGALVDLRLTHETPKIGDQIGVLVEGPMKSLRPGSL